MIFGRTAVHRLAVIISSHSLDCIHRDSVDNYQYLVTIKRSRSSNDRFAVTVRTASTRHPSDREPVGRRLALAELPSLFVGAITDANLDDRVEQGFEETDRLVVSLER